MRVAALYIYPVKACGAVALDEVALGPLGLAHDRRFAFVDEAGRALTQRDQPLLATVRPALDAETLRLDFGSLLQLVIPLRVFTRIANVDVWGKRIESRAAPDGFIAGASDFLGSRVRLVALDRDARRMFSDSEPVLVASFGSLAELNAGLDTPVGMERFRPNIVIEGETGWKNLHGANAVLERVSPCGRCEVTTIDQSSGERRGDEPLRTLNERFAGNFGVYCRVVRAGRRRVGEVLQPS